MIIGHHRHRHPEISRSVSTKNSSVGSVSHNHDLRCTRKWPFFWGGGPPQPFSTFQPCLFWLWFIYSHSMTPLKKGHQMQLQIVLLRLISSCEQASWAVTTLVGFLSQFPKSLYVSYYLYVLSSRSPFPPVSCCLVLRFSNLVSQLCAVYTYTSCQWPFLWHAPATKLIFLWDLDLMFQYFACRIISTCTDPHHHPLTRIWNSAMHIMIDCQL